MRFEQDHGELGPVADRLERERPIPRAGFRAELRASMLRSPAEGTAPPSRTRLLIGAYGASGVTLLAIALAGLLGGGPFSAS